MKKVLELSAGKKFFLSLAAIVLFLMLLILGLRLAYFGRIYPGVVANGVNLGGLTYSEATKELSKQSSLYKESPQTTTLPKSSAQISATTLGAEYQNEEAAAEAVSVGRGGNIFSNLNAQIAALFGTNPPIIKVSLNQAAVASFLVAQNSANFQPVTNASVLFTDKGIEITESKPGISVNYGLSTLALQSYFGGLNKKGLVLPLEEVEPTISNTQLQGYDSLWRHIGATPITLTYGGKNWQIEPNLVASWLAATPTDLPVTHNLLDNYYGITTRLSSTYFDNTKIAEWVHSISTDINVAPQDATLTISGDRATLFAQSRDGKTLDEASTTNSILAALNTPTTTPIALPVAVTKADVNNDNIDKLGIRELISEGVSYFPGSTAARLQNVRVGAKRYNGVLLKPGQVFSFGEILGDVGPEQGYAESKVILDGRQEFQYGGGLCQVSSTAFRAALNAGLPILQRTNHAFQVSYYTQPYGIPGVDATIYYPAVDFKFKNDTANHILIQTEMSGTTLKFRFYGTKQKEGKIRGPVFEYGSLDPNTPSKTVFYRDVIVGGQVTKTDTFTTFYKSALDFPTSN